MNFTCHTTKKGIKVSNPLHALTSLLHHLGVAGPARVRAFDGISAAKTTQGTRAPARALVFLCVLLGVLACSAAPASAEVEHQFVKSIPGISAEGTGSFTSGEKTITSVVTSSGAFIVGEEISAAGYLPSGTTIVKVEPGVLEVSNAAEKTELSVPVSLKAQQAFVLPWGLAFGAEGDLFAADPGEKGVGPSNLDVFGAAGESVARVGALAGGYTRGVAVSDATGDVYVANSGCDCLQVFQPNLQGVPALGYVELAPWMGTKTKRGSFGGQYVYVAVDNSSDAHAGDVYVLDTESNGPHMVVDVIRPTESGGEGETVQELLTPNLTGDIGAVLAVSPLTGDVYVPNANAGTVEVFNVNAELQSEQEPQGADTPALSFTPIDVAVDPTTGEVYVVDGAHHVVDEFSSGGEYEGQIPKPGEPLVEPLGVAVSSSGQVYVSDGAAKAVDVYAVEPPSLPKVEGDSVSQVTEDSATLAAQIDPHGRPGDPVTRYRFQYTTGERFAREGFTGAVSLPAPEGVLAPSFEGQSVSVPVQGLTPGTAYRFRVVAENGLGADVQDTERTFTTRTTGSFGLADGREWEMVSPPQKEGVLIEPIEGIGDGGIGGVSQAAVKGNAMTYLADAPTEPSPQGVTTFVQVLSTRGPGGWSSRDVSLPYTAAPGLSVGHGMEYRFFSEDLSQAIVQPFGVFNPARSAEASALTPFLRSDYMGGNVSEPCLPASMSCYRPLVTGKPGFANVPEGIDFGEEAICRTLSQPPPFCGPDFLAATSDLSHVVLQSGAALKAPGAGGLYEWSGGQPLAGQLKPVSLLPANGAGEELPAHNPMLNSENTLSSEKDARDVISADGSRVFWSSKTNTGENLYMRDTARGKTIQLDVPEAEPACPAIDHCGVGRVYAEFQRASANGEVVFFTDSQKLTANAAAYGNRPFEGTGGDLYECEIKDDACALTDLTPSGDVLGSVLGASKDGSWVYFVANGMLAKGAVAGSCESSQESPHAVCNLYVRHDGVTSLVAVLSGNDLPDWQLNLSGSTVRVSPDGGYLAFMSRRSLTGYDNADVASGQPDEEVYLYHAPEDLTPQSQSGTLSCASCNPTGGRPHGVEYESLPATKNMPIAGGDRVWNQTWLAANVPTWTPYTLEGSLYQSHYLSDNGRLFFNSSDALVPKDVNGTEDVYEYEPRGVGGCASASSSGSVAFKPGGKIEGGGLEEGEGCVGLISSGESAQESAFLDASATGGRDAEGHEGGGDVFFLTTSKLAPQDVDDAFDVYDAQECTAAAPCPPQPAQSPAACNTEASCKAAPSPQPGIFGAPSSATFSGPGNLAPPPVVVKKVTKKAAKCKKGRTRNKHGRCVKSKSKKKAKAKKAGTNRGGK
jgi:DNA-binding beta-propeller fold protein YncE